MADTVVMYDPTATAGNRFKSLDVREEIARVVPANAEPESIVESMIAPEAVTEDKIGPRAVTTGKIAIGGVITENLSTHAVSEEKILPGAVTPDNIGTGIVSSFDGNGNPIELKMVTLSAIAYAALDTPDANTMYIIV